MSPLRRFGSYYQPHRRLFVLDFGCAVLSGLLELAFPLAVRLFVDRLLPGHDWRLIGACAIGLLTLYLQHRPDGHRHLLGPRARHRAENRDAPESL
ncbi:MAG: hypothetical protein ABSC06_12805 [Rhodopila sp.]|jgi:ABC-type bacteriocin/lantibiotic exporter with double-glycine peptidase domain